MGIIRLAPSEQPQQQQHEGLYRSCPPGGCRPRRALLRLRRLWPWRLRRLPWLPRRLPRLLRQEVCRRRVRALGYAGYGYAAYPTAYTGLGYHYYGVYSPYT